MREEHILSCCIFRDHNLIIKCSLSIKLLDVNTLNDYIDNINKEFTEINPFDYFQSL